MSTPASCMATTTALSYTSASSREVPTVTVLAWCLTVSIDRPRSSMAWASTARAEARPGGLEDEPRQAQRRLAGQHAAEAAVVGLLQHVDDRDEHLARQRGG